MELRCCGIKRGRDGEDRLALLPRDGECGKLERLDCGTRANHGGNGFAAEACLTFREDRLVGEGRDDAEDVAAWNVRRGKHTHHAGMCGDERRDVAQPEAGAMVRRADGPDP